MPAPVGSRPITMGTVFLRAIGTAIEAGATMITAVIAIVSALGIEFWITTGTATVTSFDALAA
jgi:hypothetical protein